MSEKKLSPKSIINQAGTRLAKLRPYAFPAFLIFVGLIYGFLFLRIGTLVNTQPSDADVSAQVKAAKIPYIDEKVVDQLKALQDNSVSVQTLFNEQRTNPFQ